MGSRSPALRRPGGRLLLLIVVLLVGYYWWTAAGPTQDTQGDHPDGSSISVNDSGAQGTANDPASGLRWVDVAELPGEAEDTLALIAEGGPFPFERDGVVFGNFEGLLPDHERGYYREYTVITPGESDRGARRIVVGDGGEYYWTQDHYRSFERIRNP